MRSMEEEEEEEGSRGTMRWPQAFFLGSGEGGEGDEIDEEKVLTVRLRLACFCVGGI